MQLQVEGSDLQKLLEAATLAALGEAGKDALLKEVVRFLTTPSGGGYGGRPAISPLLEALQSASSTAAHRFFHKKLESDPEFVAMLEGLYVEAVRKFNDVASREKLTDRIAERICEAFR